MTAPLSPRFSGVYLARLQMANGSPLSRQESCELWAERLVFEANYTGQTNGIFAPYEDHCYSLYLTDDTESYDRSEYEAFTASLDPDSDADHNGLAALMKSFAARAKSATLTVTPLRNNLYHFELDLPNV